MSTMFGCLTELTGTECSTFASASRGEELNELLMGLCAASSSGRMLALTFTFSGPSMASSIETGCGPFCVETGTLSAVSAGGETR